MELFLCMITCTLAVEDSLQDEALQDKLRGHAQNSTSPTQKSEASEQCMTFFDS